MLGQVRIVSPTVLNRYGITEDTVVSQVAPPNIFGNIDDVWVHSEKIGGPVMLGFYDYEKVTYKKIEDSCKS